MFKQIRIAFYEEIWPLALSFFIVLISFSSRIFGPYTTGNDYPIQGCESLIYRFYTRNGIEPLWYPHIAGGSPFVGLAGAQIYHFPAWLLSFFPSYWDGNALELFILKTALMVFISQAALYLCLTKVFNMPKWAAFGVSILVIYNLRMTDASRFGLYLDAFTYFTTSACLISGVFLKKWGALLLPLSFYLFISAGYPPMVIYGTVGFLFLLALLVQKTRDWHATLKIAGAGILGLSLSSPIVALMFEASKTNHRRVQAADLEWANYDFLTIENILGNLFAPWSAEVQSSFGGTTALSLLLLTVLFLPFVYRKRKVMIYWLLTLFFFVFALGEQAGLFRLMFSYVPGFHWVRIPGRILNVGEALLAIFIGFVWLENRDDKTLWQSIKKMTPFIVFIYVVGSILCFMYNPKISVGFDLPMNLNPIWKNGLSLWWLVAGYLFVGALCLKMYFKRYSKISLAIITATTLFQLGTIVWYGTWIMTKAELPIPHFTTFEESENLPSYASGPLYQELELAEGTWGLASVDYFTFRENTGPEADCVLPLMKKAGFYNPLPFYFTDGWQCHSSQNPVARAHLIESLKEYKCGEGKRGFVFVENLPSCQDQIHPPRLLELNSKNHMARLGPGSTEISGVTDVQSIFVTPYSYAGDSWKVWVNGVPQKPLRVMGGLLGVAVPSGTNTVKVNFLPNSFVFAKYLTWAGIMILIVLFGLLEIPWARISRYRKFILVCCIVFSILTVPFWPIFQEEDGQVMLRTDYNDLIRVLVEKSKTGG